jgi:hypothetical protein
MATPDRETETERAFVALLDGVSAMTGVVEIGTEAGPQPVVLNQQVPGDGND